MASTRRKRIMGSLTMHGKTEEFFKPLNARHPLSRRVLSVASLRESRAAFTNNLRRSVTVTLLVGLVLSCGKTSAQQLTAAPVRMKKGLPYVTCSLEGSTPLNCLLDTGSAMTGVSRGLAKQLKLSPHTDPTIPRQDIAAQALGGLDLRIGNISWSAKRTSVAPGDLELLDTEVGPGFI